MLHVCFCLFDFRSVFYMHDNPVTESLKPAVASISVVSLMTVKANVVSQLTTEAADSQEKWTAMNWLISDESVGYFFQSVCYDVLHGCSNHEPPQLKKPWNPHRSSQLPCCPNTVLLFLSQAAEVRELPVNWTEAPVKKCLLALCGLCLCCSHCGKGTTTA